MNIYTEEEIQRIEKVKETNDRLEEFFKKKREDWNKTINPLFGVLKLDLNQSNIRNIMDSQASSLSFKQMLTEEISLYLDKRSKEEVKLKKLKQDKFIFYSVGFGLKTNLGEKAMLIDAHIAENDRTIQLIDVHVDFLRNSSKSLESLGFSIKNIIELISYLGK